MQVRVVTAVALSLCAALLAAACSLSPRGSVPPRLVGTWDLTTVTHDGATHATMHHPYLRFARDGTVRGDDSVNAWGGDYRVQGSALWITHFGTTLVGLASSAPAGMVKTAEAVHEMTQGGLVTWSISGGRLTLRAGGYTIEAERR